METTVLKPTQWAARQRKKGYKKTILSQKKLETLCVNVKTK